MTDAIAVPRDPNAVISEAKAFVVEHLAECAQELVDLEETGILCDGRMRELGRFLAPIMDSGSIGTSLAEKLVKSEALRLAADQK